jgi:glutaredoxin-dependent peroxiredoxin
MAIEVGKKAPVFTLKCKTEKGLEEVTLSSNFGKNNTVLLFFPFAFTGVCTEEMCSIRDSLASFQALNAVVYGISVDSPFSQEIFAKQEGINFPLLSDFNKEVSKAYDVLYEDFIGYKGVSKRSAFAIDKTGNIIFASSSDDPKQLPDFDAIKAALK